ncbi:MAG: cytochrome b N-terminal domain-containing protein [Gluconacetobacter diazotrophicus]|nr:cytochrome b N-terminal domain-containing protein [Gluconacetobacter diazotrophicus]
MRRGAAPAEDGTSEHAGVLVLAPDDQLPEHRFGRSPTSALPPGSSGAAHWLDARLPLLSMFRREYVSYPMPANLNGLWNFGAFLTITLALLLLSGILLATNYTATVAQAFDSVERIDRQVPEGWLVRGIHMGGVTMFFVAMYVHTWRSLYYGSFKAPREVLWLTGTVLLVLAMAAAFAGYVLPWGQMSFWGLTVASHAAGSIPVIGRPLAAWLLGGMVPGDAALHRIYVLHFVCAFAVVGVVLLHVVALHVTGSNNPLGVEPAGPSETVPFHPYYTAKDGLGVALFALAYAVLVFFLPGWLTLPDNYLPADPLSTPPDITPEWYFAPYYAILRAGGPFGLVLASGSVALLFALPWLDRSPVRSARFRPVFRPLLVLFAACFVLLAFAGFHPPSGIWLLLSRIATAYWFGFFLVALPLLSRFEPRRVPPHALRGATGRPSAA